MLVFSVIMTLLAGLAAAFAYVFFWKKGQFEDVEDVKYQMFRNKDD